MVADKESRKMKDNNDWKIDSTVIQPLIKECQIDPFFPCGRVHNELEKFDSVRISTIQSNSSRPSQDQDGNGNINTNCPPMVGSTMVVSVHTFSNRLHCVTGEQSKSPGGRSSPEGNPSSIPSPKIGRMENIRRHFEMEALSTNTP